MDFIIEESEVLGRTEKGRFIRFRLIPDSRVWERTIIGDEEGYLNKLDNTFISMKVLAEAVKTMPGLPITLDIVGLEEKEEYIKRSQKRLSEKKDDDE